MPLDPKITLTGPALDAWHDFERHHRLRESSPRTLETYGEAVSQLQRHLGAAGVLGAGRKDVEAYLLAVREATSVSTMANRYRGLLQFFRFCAAEGIIAASPMAGIPAPQPSYSVPEVLADEQLVKLLNACRGRALDQLRDMAMIRVLCEPGSPRASELAGLVLDDVDLGANMIRIRNGKGRNGGTTRIIALSDTTATAISRYKRARAAHRLAGKTDALWLGIKGPMTRSGVGQMLARRAAQASIGHVHPHQLRHTAFADFDAASDNNVNAAMALFGWSNPAMVHHYGKAARGRNAVARARQLGRGDRLAVAR